MGRTKAVAVLKKPYGNFVARIARMVWRGYAYLYYRLYAWNLKTWGESDLPQWNALFGVSALGFLNIIAVISPFDFVLHTHIVFNTDYYHGLIIAGACAFLTYSAFIRGDKFKALGKEFADETPQRRKRNAFFCWVYALGSFALLIVTAVLIH